MQLNPMEDFQRDISYRLLKQEDGTALLRAHMTDRFHDVEVEVRIEVETMKVLSARAEFRKAPTVDCRNVSAKMEGLVGFVVGRGLQRKLNEVLGGVEGCGNLRTMLIGLLPLALNLGAAAGIDNEEEMMEAIHEKLVGTCGGYLAPPAKGGTAR